MTSCIYYEVTPVHLRPLRPLWRHLSASFELYMGGITTQKVQLEEPSEGLSCLKKSIIWCLVNALLLHKWLDVFNQTSLFGRSPGKARVFEATQTTHSSAGRTNHESFPFQQETKPKQLIAKQPGTQLNSNAISPRLQINFPTRLSRVNVPLGGRLRFFHKNWNMITSDTYILEIVQGYKLDLVEILFQANLPKAKPRFGRLCRRAFNRQEKSLKIFNSVLERSLNSLILFSGTLHEPCRHQCNSFTILCGHPL